MTPTSGCKAKTKQTEEAQPRYQMPVSKQLDLCFGGVGNTGWKTPEEEGQMSFHQDEQRMPMGGQELIQKLEATEGKGGS